MYRGFESLSVRFICFLIMLSCVVKFLLFCCFNMILGVNEDKVRVVDSVNNSYNEKKSKWDVVRGNKLASVCVLATGVSVLYFGVVVFKRKQLESFVKELCMMKGRVQKSDDWGISLEERGDLVNIECIICTDTEKRFHNLFFKEDRILGEIYGVYVVDVFAGIDGNHFIDKTFITMYSQYYGNLDKIKKMSENRLEELLYFDILFDIGGYARSKSCAEEITLVFRPRALDFGVIRRVSVDCLNEDGDKNEYVLSEKGLSIFKKHDIFKYWNINVRMTEQFDTYETYYATKIM